MGAWQVSHVGQDVWRLPMHAHCTNPTLTLKIKPYDAGMGAQQVAYVGRTCGVLQCTRVGRTKPRQ